MKILLLTQYFWPESFQINEFVSDLRKAGHEVDVLTGLPNYPSGKFFPGYSLRGPYRETYEGITVLRVPLVPRGTGAGWRLALNYVSFALAACIWGPLLLRGSYNIIFAYEPSPITVGIPAVLFRRLKRAPLVFWVQDLWPESLSATHAVSSQWVLGPVKSLVRFIYARCDRVLVQSKAFTSSIRDLGTPLERISYFPNTADVLFKPIDMGTDSEEENILPDGFRVTFAGNIGAAQGFENIVDAAVRLRDKKDIHWVILGDGRQKAWVQDEVERRGLEQTVHILGHFPKNQMPRFFALSDALLVSLRNEPIFALTIPSKVQAYLACGKPIVGALEGEGARILRESAAAVVCTPESGAALAEAVLTLYHMAPEERNAMGKRGRAYFEAEFGQMNLLQQFEALLRNTHYPLPQRGRARHQDRI